MQSKGDRVSLDKSSNRSPSTIDNTSNNTFMVLKFYVLPIQRTYVFFLWIKEQTTIVSLKNQMPLQQTVNVNVISLLVLHVLQYVRKILYYKPERRYTAMFVRNLRLILFNLLFLPAFVVLI
jgi:hypothetical protein